MLRKMKNEEIINVVTDQIVSPTYVKDLAFAIISIFSLNVGIIGGGTK